MEYFYPITTLLKDQSPNLASTWETLLIIIHELTLVNEYDEVLLFHEHISN